MANTIWMIFAVALMISIFVACTLVVAAGIRWLEGAIARRRNKGADGRRGDATPTASG